MLIGPTHDAVTSVVLVDLLVQWRAFQFGIALSRRVHQRYHPDRNVRFAL
jgi:hypothetical protein